MNVRIYETPDTLKHMTIYDHTRLSAVDTCPTWGVLRYGMNKNIAGAPRAMALEAGAACHDAFAAIRFYQLQTTDRLPEHSAHWGPRVFGRERWQSMCATTKSGNSDATNAVNFMLEALGTSGYYDDPDDKRRSMSNLEATCIEYLNKWDWSRYPVWVDDVNDPTARVGIEVPIDMIIESGEEHATDGFITAQRIRYCGRMDGLHWNGPRGGSQLIVHENKTGGRLDIAWRMSFLMSHQVTGYTQGASVISGQLVKRAIVIGAQLPLPREYGNGIVYENAIREHYHVKRWTDWIFQALAQYVRYNHDPINAPKFTHSCNRYFRPCPFIPFCYEDDDGMRSMIEQMVDDEWNPLMDPGKASE